MDWRRWQGAASSGGMQHITAQQTLEGSWFVHGEYRGRSVELQVARGGRRYFRSLDTVARTLAGMGVTDWEVEQTAAVMQLQPDLFPGRPVA